MSLPRFPVVIDGMDCFAERIDTDAELAYVTMEGHTAKMGDYCVSFPGESEEKPATFKCYTPEELEAARDAAS